ncbi:Holliday junction resolvase RuvX [Capnocytophaga cynodegmi]|uniref:Putative pre-16S rRNA nuclease n=1 Tax=Capnocytophaga cynodegmi TaxID=28189 RepID=A0A0B7GYC9_9FLAO|nr:Holliday junction resolvase RuvX [Capnocytophaga cynodegmi]CEN32351.1 putative Holliday junction resolvase [Capnocytophaga cynodegmi]
MSRILAIDYGSKRCGIAVTDPLRIIASGLTTVATDELVTFLKKYISEEKVTEIVVGQPKRMNNEFSDIEKEIQEKVELLEKEFPEIIIVREDERFTSKMAFQSMIDSGLGKKQRKNKALIDEISATLILQNYMNRI